ncbi:MAG TPA: prepilin-type N-terminal cleavage/methylation domain-containing protein [Macromonas sp.]|nr:prepilin-type N-terminal cleavage/methylation domain-containing protein [Macromonas sp.]
MLKYSTLRGQQGMSLVELMVAMVIGLLILAAAGTAYIVSSKSGRDTINSTRLNIELRGAMDVMADEIRRAGAVGLLASAGVNNPFTVQTSASRTDLQVSTDGTCVEFTYDANGNGIVDTAEYSGFRVRSNAIQMRNGGAGIVNNCSDVNGSWQSLTDVNTVTIQPYATGIPYFAVSYQCLNTLNNLSQNVSCNNFTSYTGIVAGTSSDLLETRTVTVRVGGGLVQDAAMQMKVLEQVLVRNHRVVVGVAP